MTKNPTKSLLQTAMFEEMQEKNLFELAKKYAYQYNNNILNQPVFPHPENLEKLKIFEEPLSETSSPPESILAQLHQYGSPNTVAQTGGRYFGFVNGNIIPVSLAAKWLTDFWDQNFALYVMSPITSKLEQVCQNWMVELLGLPKETIAGFVSGTSTANLCGLAAARYKLLKNKGWDVNEKGIFGAPKLRIIIGAEAHSSVFRALALLGFGKADFEVVPADGQGRMMADNLPKLDATCIVITQAGNVNTGAFDPFDAICEKANEAGAWVHVDGAFGLWAAGAKQQKYLTKGLEKANSWAVDAHKTLNAPYDSGIALCKDEAAYVEALRASASYLLYSENRDGMPYTPEMSRRARAIELWAALKYLGKNGVSELVNNLHLRALQFEASLKMEGFQVLNKVVFNQVLVSCGSDELTQATLKNIQASGECWCGGAVWKGQAVIRISVCSWATTVEDVERSVRAFVKAKADV